MVNNLVRAVVGRTLIVDRDFVEMNNLQRQMLFDEDDIGIPKEEIITSLCGRNAIQITPSKPADILFKLLAERLKRSGEVRFNNFILVFKERDKEISLFKDGRAIIKGTDDEKVARSLYARYVGI